MAGRGVRRGRRAVHGAGGAPGGRHQRDARALGGDAGAIPIVLGGNSAAAIERCGRLGDGWFPYTVDPDGFKAGVEAARHAAHEAHRPAGALEITAWPGSFDPTRDTDAVLGASYLTAGADRLVLRPDLSGDRPLDALRHQVTQYRDALADRLG